ncbi:hypothetical protein BC643_4602 [Mangrovibacterium diazotrophicum]|uniref:Uncharacterized protein n=2 Tax=Mangrovibacterium diazotrophicum TaxID=1261403 RepID=A0A419VUQ9_9BACT|nr:hypothetical protein BC643_4602 [Mangrovibacterium diazotrophicum]
MQTGSNLFNIMKGLLILFFSLFSLVAVCQVPEPNNPEENPHQVNQWMVDSLNHRPIDFYLNHPDIDKYAKLFFMGKFAASDDNFTFAFLDSVLTTNEETSAFYLFVFNCVLKITDGALSEYIGQDCRAYLETYPCDFIALKHNELYAENYYKWINYAAYEYYFEEDPVASTNKSIAALKQIVAQKCADQSFELEEIRKSVIQFIAEND